MLNFGTPEIDLSNITCHSGGAEGSDTYWENIGKKYGVKTKAYSYKTEYHKSDNKVEISEDDYNEGIKMVTIANKTLNRYGIAKYMNLLARNWAQVKYSTDIFAIGSIIKNGSKNKKGYYNKSGYDIIDGGTGYAVQMGIDNGKSVWVFEQDLDKWFRWSYTSLSFVETKVPKINTENFAGIGTREIQPNGIKAIQEVYNLTFLCQ